MYKLVALLIYRKLLRDKLFVAIKVLSLALGIGSAAVLIVYLEQELSYDQHFDKHENIYRVTAVFDDVGGVQSHFASIADGFGPLFMGDNPLLGEFVRFRGSSQNILSHADTTLSWDSVWFVDEDYFDVFAHEIVAGDSANAFADIYSIAISESVARSYFGEEDAIGKILESNSYSFRVSLVFADLPANTHLKFDVLFPYKLLGAFSPNYEENYVRGLTGVNSYTYLRLNQDFDTANFPTLVDEFMDKYLNGDGYRVVLTPLASVHYQEGLIADRPSGNAFYLYGLSTAAVFILLVACINYIILALARAAQNANGIAIQKLMGAGRKQLIVQYVGESLVVTLAAMLLALASVYLALGHSSLGSLLGNDSLLEQLGRISSILSIVSISIVVALLAGLYTATSHVSVQPVRSQAPTSAGSWGSLRTGLLFLQLTICICVIASTLLMDQQLRYVNNKPLGFNSENQVWIRLLGADAIEAIPEIRNALHSSPSVIGVSSARLLPQHGTYINPIATVGDSGEGIDDTVDFMFVGPHYIETMGIELLEGSDVGEPALADGGSHGIVNESFVQRMGWNAAIGKAVSGFGGASWTIRGVVADYHYAPLSNAIGPLLIVPQNFNFEDMSPELRSIQSTLLLIHIAADRRRQTLEFIDATVRDFDSAQLFSPGFLSTELAALYVTESRLTTLITAMAGICITIAILGLYGQTAFVMYQRRKEIAMRKLLGASTSSIIQLLCGRLLLLIVLVSVPALTIAYLMVTSWMERFAYHAQGSVWPYLLAVMLVLIVSLAASVAQIVRSSQSNLIESIRYE